MKSLNMKGVEEMERQIKHFVKEGIDTDYFAWLDEAEHLEASASKGTTPMVEIQSYFTKSNLPEVIVLSSEHFTESEDDSEGGESFSFFSVVAQMIRGVR